MQKEEEGAGNTRRMEQEDLGIREEPSGGEDRRRKKGLKREGSKG